jgi:hypothetical protein
MIKQAKILILFLFIYSFMGNSILAQEEWKLVKNKNGIKVYTKHTKESNFETFRAQMRVKADVHAFVALLFDIEDFHMWGDGVKSAELLERKGDSLQIYYSEAKAPFPFKNRDGIYSNEFKWNADSNELFVNIRLLHDYLEKDDNMIRVEGKGYWRVRDLDNDSINIIFQMQIDPGGYIPSWLSSLFIDESPYNTFINLRDFINFEKYQNQKFDFIY